MVSFNFYQLVFLSAAAMMLIETPGHLNSVLALPSDISNLEKRTFGGLGGGGGGLGGAGALGGGGDGGGSGGGSGGGGSNMLNGPLSRFTKAAGGQGGSRQRRHVSSRRGAVGMERRTFGRAGLSGGGGAGGAGGTDDPGSTSAPSTGKTPPSTGPGGRTGGGGGTGPKN